MADVFSRRQPAIGKLDILETSEVRGFVRSTSRVNGEDHFEAPKEGVMCCRLTADIRCDATDHNAFHFLDSKQRAQLRIKESAVSILRDNCLTRSGLEQTVNGGASCAVP